MSKLMLCEVSTVKKISELHPAVMGLKEAAKYLGMSRDRFGRLVRGGHIPFTHHLDGVQRIFVKADLDEYLESRPRLRAGLEVAK